MLRGCVCVGRRFDKNEHDEDLEPLPEAMIPFAKTPADDFRFPPSTATHVESACRPSPWEGIVQSASSAPRLRTTVAPLIYAVDDVPDLTELYTILLEGAGCTVRAFNDRAEALTALKADPIKPDLLITDYAGVSIPVDRFVQCCLAVHTTLRILVVSGCSRTDVRFSQAGPDRFIQKPFTAEEFLQEIRDTLAA